MKPKNILYSSYFAKRVKKLPKSEKILLVKFEKSFRNDCFDPALKTHKLSGKMENLWSCSISYKTRLIFKFDKEENIIFIDIGSHAIYK